MAKTVEEAFEEWSDKPEAEAPTRHELFKKCFAAGAAHGQVEERRIMLMMIADLKTDYHKFHQSGRSDGYDIDTLEKLEARIRQRGEK